MQEQDGAEPGLRVGERQEEYDVLRWWRSIAPRRGRKCLEWHRALRKLGWPVSANLDHFPLGTFPNSSPLVPVGKDGDGWEYDAAA